jgi:hypothetical protein
MFRTGSYAPVTVLVDERADGVHLSYDRMASLLASYGNSDALNVARDLDAKVEDLLRQATNCNLKWRKGFVVTNNVKVDIGRNIALISIPSISKRFL